MYEVKKEAEGKYSLYNTKTKKSLKSIYKTRDTALRNAEKKNCAMKCVDKANEKYPMKKKKKGKDSKPKMKKAEEFKVEKVQRRGRAVVEEVPQVKKPFNFVIPPVQQVVRRGRAVEEVIEQPKRRPKLPLEIGNLISSYTRGERDYRLNVDDSMKRSENKIEEAMLRLLRERSPYEYLLRQTLPNKRGVKSSIKKLYDVYTPKLEDIDIDEDFIQSQANTLGKTRDETLKLYKSVFNKYVKAVAPKALKQYEDKRKEVSRIRNIPPDEQIKYLIIKREKPDDDNSKIKDVSIERAFMKRDPPGLYKRPIYDIVNDIGKYLRDKYKKNLIQQL